MALLLLAGLAACTKYQPIVWDGEGSWTLARKLANARPRVPDKADRVVAQPRQRPAAVPATSSATAEDSRRHRVVAGDTLFELAQRYGVPVAVLARANGIGQPFRVHAGQVLAIPPAGPARPSAPAARPAAPLALVAQEVGASPPPADRPIVPAALAPAIRTEQAEAARRAAQVRPPALSGDGFLWPVRGRLASGFGEKPNGARNDGINIAAAEGTAVLAAENGIVVYAGDELPGYGNMLLLRHAGEYTTAYAHARELLVGVGATVTRGQKIATVGATGAVESPQLHFELRAGKQPIDPLAHLTQGRTQLASTAR
jgi:murein DD-endopeptidase MepM/ murein hydrolase activator NlpD